MKIINRKARFNYQLLERFETGISLTGAEVKAVRGRKVNLTNAYAKVISGEVYLVNANLSGINVEKPTRTRKLLLHKKEIVGLALKIKAKKLTLVPVAMYTRGHLVKVELALAKTKKKYQKKELLKKKDIEREIEQELRDKS